MPRKQIISILVDNHPGVLLRISGLFSRRGYNIDSLVACETENSAFSRITIALTADDATVKQILGQITKVEDVEKVTLLSEDGVSHSELLLIKISVINRQRAAVLKIIRAFDAQVLDIAHKTMTIEATGQTDAINDLIHKLQSFPVLEMARTGIVALERGDGSINDRALQ